MRIQKLITLAGFGLSLCLVAVPEKTFAQQPVINQQNYEYNSSDPFNHGTEEDSFGNMFQLMHNLNLNNMNANFQPGEAMNDAISTFRQRQAEALKQQGFGNKPNNSLENNSSTPNQ